MDKQILLAFVLETKVASLSPTRTICFSTICILLISLINAYAIMEDGGFQLVSRKKAARAPKRPCPNQFQDKYGGLTTSEILTRISELKQVCLELLVTFSP